MQIPTFPTDEAPKLSNALQAFRDWLLNGLSVARIRVGDYLWDNSGDIEVHGFTMAEGATDGYALLCDGDGTATWTDLPDSVAGSDTEVQFNDGGVLGADSNLTYSKGAKRLSTRTFRAIDSTGVKLYNTSDGGIRICNDYGHVGINCEPGSGSDLDIDGDTIRLRSLLTPASASAGGKQGMITIDGNYIYVCVSTNTWKRASLATW